MIAGVVFDLDGVLLDSEHLWDIARKALTEERGGTWHDRAQRDMMGMSSREWSQYMHDQLGVPLSPQEISRESVERVKALMNEDFPVLPGAQEAVMRLAERWPLALATSSNRPVIDYVLPKGGFAEFFRATVSSEEVARGKPAPDVYLRAAELLGLEPERCAAIEDSHNGILSARAARMRVIAIPNKRYPPGQQALITTDAIIESIDLLTPEIVDPTIVPA
ncbi:MAG: HAD family phosphatase [Candidatus Eremiobacteraeota bacterium]|nr:HAD family phosphatase [Candidatus Eremiobacteraeota bacterium]